MKPGDLRRWNTIHGDRLILVVRIHGQKNGYCDYLEDGKLHEWAPVLLVEANSEAIYD